MKQLRTEDVMQFLPVLLLGPPTPAANLPSLGQVSESVTLGTSKSNMTAPTAPLHPLSQLLPKSQATMKPLSSTMYIASNFNRLDLTLHITGACWMAGRGCGRGHHHCCGTHRQTPCPAFRSQHICLAGKPSVQQTHTST
jgi:hypothetical protein